ncbi:MAG TPA: DUF6502 family protein [Steroidobacteraceae bacterium]|nr:DUF6502 family protein [Steroidobacteraceae bacterium]
MRLRDAARAQLIFSFRKILKPMIRILLKAGVPYLEFREVLKGAYVEAAVRDKIPGHEGPLTRAMISDYTEVPLADVNRFIDDPRLLAPPESTNAAIISEVLFLWCTDNEYIGPYGLPLELDLEATPGKNLSILVYRADPSANPAAVVRDMVDWGIVKPVGSRHFRPVARTMVFSDVLTPQALEYFGSAMTDLANTILHNIRADTTSGKRLQRSVIEDDLPEYALPEFDALLKEKVQKLLNDIDDWISSSKVHWTEPARRVPTGLTVFHHVAEPYDTTPLESLMDRRDAESPKAWTSTPERVGWKKPDFAD